MSDRTGSSALARHSLLAVAVVAAGVGVSFALPDHRLFAFGQWVAYLVVVAGLSQLVGLSGQLSIGHAGLMAAGGYGMALIQNALYDAGFTVAAPPRGSGRFAAAAEPVAAPWTLPVSLLGGVLVAVVVGGALALAAARLRGPYLAGATLAFGLVVLPVAALIGALGGEQGLSVRVPRAPAGLAVDERQWRVWVMLAAVAPALVLLANVSRGRLGRELRAVRDDETAAALAGIPVARVRVLAFVVSAGVAGLGGGLYVYLTATVLPGYFGLTLSLYLLLAVVVGGAGSLVGSAWGTLFIIAVPIATTQFVQALDPDPAFAARLTGNLPLALFGIVLVIVTLATPGGIQGALRRRVTRWQRREPDSPDRLWGMPPGRRGAGATYDNEQSIPGEDGVRTP